MGKLKKLYAKNFNELTEPSDTEIYPVTSFKSVFDIHNISLEDFIENNLQYKFDETLSTQNKNIVGAINELKSSIGQGGGSSGSIDLSNYITKNGDENIGGYKTFSGTSKFTGVFIPPINVPSNITDIAFYIGNIGFDVSSPSTGGEGGGTQYYVFLDGSDGSFQVTPSGGTTQTVKIGKPDTSGTADIANKLGTTTVGSATVPIYLSNGIPTECSLSSSSTPGTNVYWDTDSVPEGYISLNVGGTAKNIALQNHKHLWSQIDDTPTTLVDYGITDVYTKNDIDRNFVTINGEHQTIEGAKTFTNTIDFTGTLLFPKSLPTVSDNEVAIYIDSIGFDATSPSTGGTDVIWGNKENNFRILSVGGVPENVALLGHTHTWDDITGTLNLTNYVTTNTAQDIEGIKTFTSSTNFTVAINIGDVNIYNEESPGQLTIDATDITLAANVYLTKALPSTLILPVTNPRISSGENALFVGTTGFDGVTGTSVVQVTGTSTTNVMSQKACTDLFALKTTLSTYQKKNDGIGLSRFPADKQSITGALNYLRDLMVTHNWLPN